jgi:sarcosine oxidase subunit alpha
MHSSRLESGGQIDRSKSIEFCFDGKLLTGFLGDTLASALLANDVSVVARSIKYHRPRGILSAGLEEPSALVTCTDQSGNLIPNLKVTEVWLRKGLQAYSQNNWPSLRFDIGALLQLLRRFLVPGFFYKTFMWPPDAWHRVYERVIRRFAGQGKITLTPDKRLYDKRHTSCDTLVIGAGTRGIDEALAASGRNESVLLIDQDSVVGGSSLWDSQLYEGENQKQLFQKKIAQLQKDSRIRIIVSPTVTTHRRLNPDR